VEQPGATPLRLCEDPEPIRPQPLAL